VTGTAGNLVGCWAWIGAQWAPQLSHLTDATDRVAVTTKQTEASPPENQP